jgi:hypothetical protein
MAMVRNGTEEKLRTFADHTVAMPQMCSFNIEKTDVAIIGCFVKRCLREDFCV